MNTLLPNMVDQQPSSTTPVILVCPTSVVYFWGPTHPASEQPQVIAPTRHISPKVTWEDTIKIPINDELYICVSKRKMSELHKYAKIGKRFEQVIQNNKYQNTPLIGRLAALYVLIVGINAIANMIVLATTEFLSNVGGSYIDISHLVYCCPLSTCLKQLLICLAAEAVLILEQIIHGKQLSLICNNGEDSGQSVSFVKLICYYDDEIKAVEVRYVGIETAGNTS